MRRKEAVFGKRAPFYSETELRFANPFWENENVPHARRAHKRDRHLRFLPSLNTRFPCGVAWVQMVGCVSVEKGGRQRIFSAAWYNTVSHFGCRTATQTVKLTQARHDSAAQRFYLCRLSKSCGCGIIKALIHRNKYAPRKDHHKYKDYSLYRVWIGIKKRCFSKTEPAYPDYGGRGITVCDEWKNDYEKFLQWSLENGYKKGLTIDRIDSNGNYEPSNCRWATMREQAQNTSRNHFITHNGERQCIAEWCRELNIRTSTFCQRMKNGLNPFTGERE